MQVAISCELQQFLLHKPKPLLSTNVSIVIRFSPHESAIDPKWSIQWMWYVVRSIRLIVNLNRFNQFMEPGPASVYCRNFVWSKTNSAISIQNSCPISNEKLFQNQIFPTQSTSLQRKIYPKFHAICDWVDYYLNRWGYVLDCFKLKNNHQWQRAMVFNV